MKSALIVIALCVLFSGCKHPRNYYLPKTRTAQPSRVETKKEVVAPDEQQSPAASNRRTANAAPQNQRVAVEIIKQMQLGNSIEAFVANVYTRVGTRKTYLATKMPCKAARGSTTDEGMFNCQFMPNDMDVAVKIVRGGNRTASVTIPGDPQGPHEMKCQLKYDHESFQNRGPEATKTGVLHRLQEVTCVE